MVANPLLPRCTHAKWGMCSDCRAAWLNVRRTTIGASEVAAVMGISPWTSRYALWWQKTSGWDTDDNMTEEQEWGLRLERVIAERFQDDMGTALIVMPAGLIYVHRKHDWATCSPDRLAVTRRGTYPLELKADQSFGMCNCGCDQPLWGDNGTDIIPHHYLTQVLWQCYVLGVSRGYLARLDGKEQRWYLVKTADHRPLLKSLVVETKAFMRDVRDGREPDVDDHDATRRALMDRYWPVEDSFPVVLPAELVAEYHRLKDAKADNEKAVALIENEIRAALGDAKVGVDPDGNTVVTRSITHRRGYTVDAKMVDSLRRTKRR